MNALDLGDLSATLSVDTSGVNKAERDFKRAANDMDREAKQLQRGLEGKLAPAFGKVATAAGALAGVAVAAGGAWLTKQMADMHEAARQADIYSQALKVNVEDFGRWTYAAKTVGIQADKVGDIFKDTADKLGDAFTNQGGEAYEVLENLGLSAEKLSLMSPDKAILEMAAAMEGLDNATKVQMFESIADDASLLIPLLSDNAERFRELSAEADKYAYTLDKKTVKQSRELREASRELDGELNRLARDINETLIPALAEAAGFAADVVEFWTRDEVQQVEDQIRKLENIRKAMAGRDETTYDWLGKKLGFDENSQQERIAKLDELDAKIEALKRKKEGLVWDQAGDDPRAYVHRNPRTQNPDTDTEQVRPRPRRRIRREDEPELSAYDRELKSYSESLERAQAAEDALLEKHAMLNDAFMAGEIGPAVYAQEVAALNAGMVDGHQQAMAAMVRAAEEASNRMEGVFTNGFYAIMQGEGFDFLASFKSMVDRMVAEWLAAQAVMKAASFFGDLGGLSPLFGGGAGVSGGRAVGGPVSAGNMYEVTENGPELFSAGGKDYLLTGGKNGSVTPVREGGGDKPVQIVQNIYTQDADSFRRSKAQIAREQERALTRARRQS